MKGDMAALGAAYANLCKAMDTKDVANLSRERLNATKESPGDYLKLAAK